MPDERPVTHIGHDELWGIGCLAIVAVVGYLAWQGGKLVWQNEVGPLAPDENCVWLMRGEVGECVIDKHRDGCFPAGWSKQHLLVCPEGADQAASFIQKTGRKLCSPVIVPCPAR